MRDDKIWNEIGPKPAGSAIDTGRQQRTASKIYNKQEMFYNDYYILFIP